MNQLEESVRSALKKEVGSDEAPDIFPAMRIPLMRFSRWAIWRIFLPI